MDRKSWKQGKVGDLLLGLESGVSVNGEEKSVLDTDKCVLKVSAVSYGTFNPNAAKVINNDELPRAKTNPKAGQIIISRSNTEELVGASAYIDKDYPNLFLPDKLWQTIPKQGANMKWLGYVLSSPKIRYTLSKLATGTSGSMKNITKDELLSLKIDIPPLPEQIKIAEILSTWDNAIQTTEKQLTNSQQQKKALMQMLLSGEKRVSGFSGEWGTVTLSQIANIKKGKALSSKDIIDGIYPVIAGGKTSPYNHNAYTDENVVTVSASGAYAGFVSYHPYKIWASDCSVISAKKCSDILFIFQILLYFQETIYSLQSGGAQPHIYPKDLDRLKFNIPQEINEQQKIAEILTTADQEIETLQKKLECLKLEKRALMQGLL